MFVLSLSTDRSGKIAKWGSDIHDYYLAPRHARRCRITGYTTGIGFFGHSVGESNEEIRALIAGSPEYAWPGFTVPGRNTDLLRWCLNNNLRIIQNMR